MVPSLSLPSIRWRALEDGVGTVLAQVRLPDVLAVGKVEALVPQANGGTTVTELVVVDRQTDTVAVSVIVVLTVCVTAGNVAVWKMEAVTVAVTVGVTVGTLSMQEHASASCWSDGRSAHTPVMKSGNAAARSDSERRPAAKPWPRTR